MKDIYKILAEIGVAYIKHDHEPFFTCEDADEFYKNLVGGHSKNLFLRNRKGDRYYLVVVESHKKVDLKLLSEKLYESKLGFASADRLERVLGLTPGSVSPFGLIHDEEKNVVVVVDEDLMQYDKLYYHPNINTATLEISRQDLQKFLDWCGNEVKFMSI